MRILIWGAGAIGGVIGAYLVRAGHEITFVDRAADHVDAINRDGLAITGPIDEFTVTARAYTPADVPGVHDAILLCVKAQDTAAAAQALAPHLAADGYVVSVQNGLNELVIADIVGKARTVGAFVNFGADYLEPGLLLYGGRGAVVLGELDGATTPRLVALHAALLDFEPNAIITDNIWGYLWGKLAYGAQLFATAVTNDSIADCLADPAYHAVYIALGQEVMRVAAANHVTPEGFNGFDPLAFMPDTPRDVSLRSLDDMVAFNRKSAKTHSGIWRDLAVRKRRTEVDAQLGPIVTIGASLGVATPLTARLIELIHAIEDGALPMQTANLDELARLLP
ncbi:MAG: ketopantoate reductase family protein [Caldilineaceae bacterium]|nr:ketopantoate reductase family protein [Caldilineaceae bacterium]